MISGTYLLLPHEPTFLGGARRDLDLESAAPDRPVMASARIYVHTSTTTEPTRAYDFPAIVGQVCEGRGSLVNSPARALRLIWKEPRAVINRMQVNVCKACVLLAIWG